MGNYSDAVSAETRKAQDESLGRARSLAKEYWDPYTAERLQYSAKGESSPWIGVKQWLSEIPLNTSMRGYDPNAENAIAVREKSFQDEMTRLRALAARKQSGENVGQIVPQNVWSGVK